MKLLVFSTLYPNACTPHHGIFVENRLRHLLAASGWSARVVAPVPWVPPGARHLARYAAFAGVPRAERRHGLAVLHPRFPVIPKAGMSLAPALLYAAARGPVRRLLAEGYDFDVIDAHYFYPDGVAAALLARELDRPFTVTGRGTDLNLIPRHRVPRSQIRWTARRAAGLVTVCEALADDLAGLGIARERVRVLRNGVDLAVFRPDPAGAARLRTVLALAPPVLLSVGHLIPRKGHDHVLRAFAALDRGSLVIAGQGPEEAALRHLAAELGVAERVRFTGAVPHERLRTWYSAADVLVLASSREGWPNVLLESMACGTPVVATAVNGTPEVVRAPQVGRVVAERSGAALQAAVAELLRQPPARAAVRRYAEDFSWDATSQGQIEMFEGIAGTRTCPDRDDLGRGMPPRRIGALPVE